MTRRTAIGALGAASLALGQTPQPDAEPKPKFGNSAPRRTAPMLCMFSRDMAPVPYYQLGELAGQIGFEGIDLTVMIGGHVDPRITNVDLVRAFEAIRGANLEVPMITTSITSVSDLTCYPVMYLSGHSQVPFFRLGLWPYDDSGDIRQRILQVRRDLTQITSLAQRCEISALFANHAGAFVGESSWDTQSIVADMDPRLVNHMFDPAEAMIEGGLGGWETALKLVLPRLKAVSLQDFYWAKEGTSWSVRKCPLGEGMVDWDKFFKILAGAKFTGPMSIAIEYAPKSMPAALGKDLEFARQHVQKAWPAT